MVAVSGATDGGDGVANDADVGVNCDCGVGVIVEPCGR